VIAVCPKCDKPEKFAALEKAGVHTVKSAAELGKGVKEAIGW
jgi:hypothetical protein